MRFSLSALIAALTALKVYPPATGGGGSGVVQTIQAGTGIDVDATDPANPVVSATGGSGGGDGFPTTGVGLFNGTSARFETTSAVQAFAGEDGVEDNAYFSMSRNGVDDIGASLGTFNSTNQTRQIAFSGSDVVIQNGSGALFFDDVAGTPRALKDNFSVPADVLTPESLTTKQYVDDAIAGAGGGGGLPTTGDAVFDGNSVQLNTDTGVTALSGEVGSDNAFVTVTGEITDDRTFAGGTVDSANKTRQISISCTQVVLQNDDVALIMDTLTDTPIALKGLNSAPEPADVPFPESLTTKQYVDAAVAAVGGGGGAPWSRSGYIPAPVETDKIPVTYVTEEVTLSRVVSVLPGAGSSPSVEFNIHFGADISAAGTPVFAAPVTVSNISTGRSDTVFDEAVIPADSFVWIVIGAVAGAVPGLSVTLQG